MLSRFLPELASLDADLREAFLEKLRVRWTHTSTALEGNTLTEGETLGVLQYGLTVAGKPLAHHNEVLGHSRALDLIYSWMADGRPVTEADLHSLHAAIQTSVEVDYLKPIGAWKREPNSTLAKVGGKTAINDTYASPADVPELMRKWLETFEQWRRDPSVTPLDAYSLSHATFVRIHPYADGNGRMARLIANISVIEKGHLPILIPDTSRLRYIETLAAWQMASGPLTLQTSLTGDSESFKPFVAFCSECLRESAALIDEVRGLQESRRARRS